MAEIPNGRYRARPVAGSAVYGETKNGKEYVFVNFTLLDENYPGVEIGKEFYTTTEKGIEFATKALIACGWTGKDFTDLDSVDGDKEVELVIENETYEGKTYPRIKFVNDPDNAPFVRAPMPPAKAKAAAAKARAKIAEVRAQMKTKKGSEEIPF